jgi:hypothetical protein
MHNATARLICWPSTAAYKFSYKHFLHVSFGKIHQIWLRMKQHVRHMLS